MKKILFVTNSLGLGGSEKAMTEMINRMDLEKYDITILALIKTETILSFDSRINIINGLDVYDKIMMPFKKFLMSFGKGYKLNLLLDKLMFSLQCKYNFKHTHISKFFWKAFSKYIPKIEEEFDVVIGYGQGPSTYFIKDKVKAYRKVAWLNTDLEKARYDIGYIKQFYAIADYIVVDSENGKKIISKIYPEMIEKTRVFPNILDVSGIIEKGREKEDVISNVDVITILSVGRLVEAKAFHLAVGAADILCKKGIDFKWFIVGDGSERDMLTRLIKEQKLEEKVIMLGADTNPYKYMNSCDIYVQTSIYEGSGMTINEAMIFNKPIVSTNFPAVYEKIIDGKNGLLAEMTAESIAEKLNILINDMSLRESFSEYLKENPIDYDKQIEELDDILL